ncbi:Vitamin K-dependent gamma-carboxylase [Eumeta japonica]|uniref:Vitamin K-dependent gamma-carboxylase n=1 Tax=Eumeta variegata TaxID=151549 RepID=A0A4C2A147_EUMVA|nr:Vitamin K-dependent gamma-carboxylase [Eumeta japonica]
MWYITDSVLLLQQRATRLSRSLVNLAAHATADRRSQKDSFCPERESVVRSIDAYLNPSIQNTPVPYWNYFVLKYQFFILYFVAGLKKGTAEWLTGYSLVNLSEHWVFDPFKLFLSVPQIDYLIVHWFAFIFDLTVAFWMMWGRSRNIAMVFCAAFHIMNIRLFKIGNATGLALEYSSLAPDTARDNAALG